MNRHRCLLVFVAVGLSVLGWSAGRHLLYRRALEQRVADMAALLEAYKVVSQTNASPTMGDLMQVLSNANISLYMPLRMDKRKLAYRVATYADGLEADPERVVVEETENVKDPGVRVVGLADGSIRLRRK